MKVMTILGTRPEIIRLSRIIEKLDSLCDHVLVHTGQNYDPELMKKAINDANEILKQDLPISVTFKTREEAMKIPGITKLAKGLPEHIQDVRIVSIGDFDVQADGGTHPRSTKEVGQIVFIKAKNKGKGRKRAYFTVE